MKKIKLLLVAIILLTGCTNTKVENENQNLAQNLEVSEQTQIDSPSDILKNLQNTNESLQEAKEARIDIKKESLENSIKSIDEVDSTKKETILNDIKEKKNEKQISKSKKNIVKEKTQKAIDKFVNLETLRYSNIGISIVDLKTGETIGSYHKEAAMNPASVFKVITSATALEVLGANTRLETKLLYDGKIDNEGILKGDVYIVGGGDPTLGSDGIKVKQSAFMEDWISKIEAAQIKKIDGDIIVIDNLFGYVGVEEKWLWEDFGTSYGQGTYGISIFDNLYTLYLKSDVKNVKIVGTKPEIEGLKFENRLKVSEKGRKSFSVRGLAFENKRILNGEVPANQEKIVTKSDIPNPGLFLGQYFKNSLKTAGIAVNGEVKTSRNTNKRPKNPNTLAITKSATIEEMVRVLLKRSDNHYTEHLYQLIKLKDVDIEEFWKAKGVDTKALVMNDGSGLSRGDYVSADILTNILVYMNKNYSGFDKLLPRGGYEGTVSDFLEPSVFSGDVRVKSGSMSGIQSYTGYVKKDGRELAFTIIVNHWNGSRNKLKDNMETLINDLF